MNGKPGGASRPESETIREHVRQGYAEIAGKTEQEGCCSGASCCGSSPDVSAKLALEVGYTEQELAVLPDGANMGLSCGNPTALASLKSGDVVLDLGCGGGFDVFIAGEKVGPAGRAIGVDMTPEMLSKARRNSLVYQRRTGLQNVDFRLGEIEHLPVADNSVDVVVSNCVINLSPDKAQVWREIARVMKPGGRVAISDMALFQPLPETVRELAQAWLGCIAGAVLIEETRTMATAAGLTELKLDTKPEYVAALSNWNDSLYQEMLRHLPPNQKPADYVTSLSVSGRKP